MGASGNTVTSHLVEQSLGGMMIKSSIASMAGLLVFLLSQGLSYCQEESAKNQTEKHDKASGSSFLRAMAINAASVQTLDVLVRQEDTHDIAASMMKHSCVLTRLVIDFPNERFLIVQFVDSSHVVDGSESRKSLRYSSRYDGTELFESEFKRVVGSTMSFKDALYRLPGVVDLRYVGFRRFPVHFGQHFDFDTFAAATEQLDLKCLEQKITNKTQAVSLQRKFLKSDDIKIQNWVFDQERLIAICYSDSISKVEYGERQVYPLTRETIDWQEHAGSFVPKKIKAVGLGQIQLEGSNKVLSYEIDVDGDFHWFSVNEPLTDDKFSADYLSDVSKAFALVDPKLSGATSLKQ